MSTKIIFLIIFVCYGCIGPQGPYSHDQPFTYAKSIVWQGNDSLTVIIDKNTSTRCLPSTPNYGSCSYFTFKIENNAKDVLFAISTDSINYKEVFSGNLNSGEYSFIFAITNNKQSSGFIKENTTGRMVTRHVIFDF